METKLIIASSETDADMYYATHILITDDFVYLEMNGKKIIYVSSMEYSRVMEEAQVDEIINTQNRPPKFKSNLSWIVTENKIKKITVPGNFPIKYALELEKLGVKIKVSSGSFFKERTVKNEEEIRNIRFTQKINDGAMQNAIEVIKESSIRKDLKLEYRGKILTSEFLKEIVEISFLRGGCKSEDDIVSSGEDSAQPHNFGSGVIFAHQPIIIDLYPRNVKNRYYADMTRTVVKGKASPEIKKIYDTVLKGQKLAIQNVKAGIEISSLEKSVREYFGKAGYETESSNASPQGFIHNLGHGVGLNVHELPSVNIWNKQKLEAGSVITIEPGLYYPGIGGVRIEDMVLVTEEGCKNLTKSPKILEIN